MRTLRPLALLALALPAGCSNENQTVDMIVIHDMSMLPDQAQAVDLTVVDEAVPPDLSMSTADLSSADGSAFCAGTPVAGTCLQTVLGVVAACFVDPAGACTQQMVSQTQTTWCWTNGDEFSATINMMTMSATGDWKNGTTDCMAAAAQASKTGSGGLFKISTNGQTITFDEGNGDATCPDGSKINVGPADGKCPALQALLNPPMVNCNAGACP